MSTPTNMETQIAALDDDLKKLGEQVGYGRDAQIKFGLKLVEAAYDGLIDLSPNGAGPNRDDATARCEAYALGQRNATKFDTRTDSAKVQISKARACIKLGLYTLGGTGEPINTVNKLMMLRNRMRQDPAMAKRLDDAYGTLLRYARAQVKSKTIIDDDETLRSFIMKPQKGSKTLAQTLRKLQRDIDNVISGKAANGTVQDNHELLVEARDNVALRLEEIEPRKRPKAPVLTTARATEDDDEAVTNADDDAEGDDDEGGDTALGDDAGDDEARAAA